MVSAILTICLSAVLVQTISAQCRGNPGLPVAPIAEAVPNNMPYAPIPEQNMIIPDNAAIFNGGGFKVASFSNAGPTGLKVQSDNLVVEGPLSVTGKLPFLGVVTVEGPLPAAGEGTVAYECGNGNVGIMSEGVLGNELGAAAGLPGIAAGMPGMAASLPGNGYNQYYNAVGNGMPIGRY